MPTSERAGEHIIGLACGHFWPGEGASDEHALMFLDHLVATGDTAFCGRCGSQQAITGPAARVLSHPVVSGVAAGPESAPIGPESHI